MFYICTTCPFVVHLKCSSITLSAKPPTIDAEIHEHPLILVPRSSPFTCDACGKEDKARFYFCTICSFVVHQKCTSLSSTVKVLIHKQHPLNVIYSLQDNQSHRKACPICAQTVNTNYRFYYCSSCDFLTHLHCAITVDRDEKSLWSGIDVSPYDVVKKMKLGEDGNGIAVEIKHFNHEHELKLTDELDMKEQCDGFNLDVQCSLVPNILKHDGHEHQLICFHSSDRVKCSCCDSSSQYIFRSGDCEFVLDFKCATLPHSAIYRSHKHPFKLWYTAEDDSGEYYCDICKEKRDPKHGFYYCAACNYAAHPNCILKYEYDRD